MNINEDKILKAVRRTQILLAFQRFTEKIKSNQEERSKIVNLVWSKNDRNERAIVIRNIFRQDFDFALDNIDESLYMLDLVEAFLRKSNTRNPKPIDDDTKKSLLKKQDYKCAFCEKNLSNDYAVDHIVPFKYVGDELKNNYQILCKSCNSKKNKDLTYELMMILNGGMKND